MSSKNFNSISIPKDVYYTPDWAVDEFFKHAWPIMGLPVPETILDPCCGAGVFKTVSSKYFPKTTYTQLDVNSEDSNSAAEDFVDFTQWFTADFRYDLVISNPPYTIAQEFVTKALSVSDNVVYLLRLNFLGSKKRTAFFNDNTPKHIFVMPKRPSFIKGGTDSTEYAWFHFTKEKNDYSKLIRLPNS